MERRRIWIALALIGLALIAVTPGLFMMGDIGAPLWLGPLGYLVLLIAVAGFVWSMIVRARASRPDSHPRNKPV